MKIVKMNTLQGFKIMSLFAEKKEAEARLALVQACLLNDDGTAIDLEVTPFSDVVGLLDEILELNGMGEEEGN